MKSNYNMSEKKIGPNIKKLIAHKIAIDAIPPGGNFADGVEFLISGKLAETGRNAAEWVRHAIELVKSSPDNPFGDDDEAIADELLRRIEDKKQAR